MVDKVLVTGGTGFVGGAVLRGLSARGRSAVAAVRSPDAVLPAGVPAFTTGDLDSDTVWQSAFEGVSVVVHAAARVHVMRETADGCLAEFRRINVTGTLNLARQAAEAGVRRFVFISSIKVNGERTQPGQAFRNDDPPLPVDPYGLSKSEAEQRLTELAHQFGMEFVVVRPCLVYGPGVRANFLSMLHWLDKGVPLPLGAIHNQRSLLALDNLVDLIVACTEHPAAANQIFLAADGEDLSTTALLRRLGDALGTPARLVPVPTAILRAGAALIGKRAIAERLCGSLQVDISKTRSILGWKPPLSVDEGLARTVEWYRASHRGGGA